MDEHVIRLSKVTKIIGIIDIIVFLVCTLYAFLEGSLFASIVFLAFVLLGVYLILAYKKQVIIIKEDEIVFNYFMKKPRHIKYNSIRCLLLIPLNNKTDKVLIDRQYHRIISLDEMFMDLEMLFDMLNKKQIPAVDFEKLAEENKDISMYVDALNSLERYHYKSAAVENKTIEKLSKGKSKTNVKNTRKILKIIGWILIIANGAAFLIGGRGMMILLIAILLFTYGLYLKYYPYIYVDTVSKKGQNQCLQLPFMGAAIAMLLNLTMTKLYNYDFVDFLKSTAMITLILVLVFLIKSVKVSVPQRIGRKISVIFAAFTIAFCITFPVNFLLTFDSPKHDIVIITDKDISGGKTTDYYLYCSWNGEEESFNVSRSEYEETNIGDRRRICRKKSLLGLEYYTVHK